MARILDNVSNELWDSSGFYSRSIVFKILRILTIYRLFSVPVCRVALLTCLPDIFVVVDVDLVELLGQQIFVNGDHVGNHLQDDKSGQDGHYQTLLKDTDIVWWNLSTRRYGCACLTAACVRNLFFHLFVEETMWSAWMHFFFGVNLSFYLSVVLSLQPDSSLYTASGL